jgi:transcriptional regulator
VLYRRHDAPRSEEQWKAFLLEHRFGQLVAAGDGSEPPFVIPAHFSYDGDAMIRLHLHRDNPVWKALEQNPVAVMAVLDAYAFIPSYWNEPMPYGVATSFYAAVQAIGTCRFVDDPDELADLIGYQLRDLQPESGQDPPLNAEERLYLQMLKLDDRPAPDHRPRGLHRRVLLGTRSTRRSSTTWTTWSPPVRPSGRRSSRTKELDLLLLGGGGPVRGGDRRSRPARAR